MLNCVDLAGRLKLYTCESISTAFLCQLNTNKSPYLNDTFASVAVTEEEIKSVIAAVVRPTALDVKTTQIACIPCE